MLIYKSGNADVELDRTHNHEVGIPMWNPKNDPRLLLSSVKPNGEVEAKEKNGKVEEGTAEDGRVTCMHPFTYLMLVQ